MTLCLRSGQGFTINEVRQHQKALLAGTANTTGLPALPTELLFEIISHFPSVPVTFDHHPNLPHNAAIYPASYLEKHRILCALSQMCQSLRRSLLPYVWKKIEVCASNYLDEELAMSKPFSMNLAKALAKELVRQLEIVTIREWPFASHVTVVNVTITEFSQQSVLPELARCLADFSNLHTLQLLSGRPWIYNSIKVAFEGRIFPSVRTLVVDLSTYPVMACCQEVRQVTALNPCPSLRFIPPLDSVYAMFNQCLENCFQLEVLRGFEVFPDIGTLFHHMIKKFPLTRIVTLCAQNRTLTPENVRSLSQFPKLSCIELYINADANDPITSRSQTIFEAAIVALRGTPEVEGSQQIKLKFLDTVTTYPLWTTTNVVHNINK